MANLSDHLVNYQSNDTLDSVTSRGATTTNDLTIGSLLFSTGASLTSSGTNSSLQGSAGNTGAMALYGGPDYNSGSGVAVYGASHSSQADKIRFFTSGFTERMVMNSDGDVHISTLNTFLTLGPTLNSSGTGTGIGIRGSTPRMYFEPTGDNQQARIIFANTGGTSWGSIYAYNDTERIQITANTVNFNGANVGIGTDSPSYLLHVSKAGLTRVGVEATDASGADIIFLSNGTLGGVVGDRGDGTFDIDYRGGNVLTFSSTGAERARITASGNFLIGTTNDLRKLTVQSAAQVVGHFDSTNSGNTCYLELHNAASGAGDYVRIGSTSANMIFTTGSGAVNMTLDNTGDLYVYNGGIVAPGQHKIGTHRYYKQNWWFGGSTDLNWKKIADVTIGTGSYGAASFLVKYINPGSNYGASVTYEVEQYTVMCGRSNATPDGMDYGLVRGPYSDRVRAFKTATGVYEIQVRQYGSYRHIGVEIQAQSELKATITYAGSTLSNGSTTGTAYVPTGENIQGFTESTTARGLFKVNDSSGNQIIRVDADGLKFGSNTAASHALNDYEEGLWTPQLNDGTNTINLTGIHSYRKIGALVVATCSSYNFGITGLNTSHLRIQNLPFTASSQNNSAAIGRTSSTTEPTVFMEVTNNSNFGYLYGKGNGSGANVLSYVKTYFQSASVGSIWITITYVTTP